MQFAPTYHDYVLYSNDTEAAPKRYRTRTFVPTGQEMEAARTGKSPRHGDNTKITVNDPSSDAARNRGGIIDMTGGPLINEAELRRSYDMSPLDMPAVISHQTVVEGDLEPGKVRPAQ